MKKTLLFATCLFSLLCTNGKSTASPTFMGNKSMEEQEPAYEIAGRDSVCSIFVYSPGEKEGLRIAYLTDKEKWHDIGQLCGSDYGPWGAEKKMYNPYVYHAEDGTWRLLFSVNNHAPCFAAAYSEDLITWRPQDYPRTSVKGIGKPVMFQMDDGTFDIYVKAKDGTRRYIKADKDFRRFTEAVEPSSISDDAWLMDSATIAGKKYEGNQFDVPKVHLDYIRQYFHAVDNEAILSSERMKDDEKRFASIGSNVNATLTINPSQTKAISDKLIGVFFEDISYAADGGLYAELIQNRDFEYSPEDHRGWQPSTAWFSNNTITIKTDKPLSTNNPHYAVLAKGDTLYNNGWDGISASPMEQFDLSIYLRTSNGKNGQMAVALIGSNGNVYAKGKTKIQGSGWQRYRLPLSINKKVTKGNVRLALTPLKDGSVDVDMVSLFPHDTFKGHGLRKDLAEAIAALNPKFVRFPGGCMTHGQGIDNIYHWQESIGPWQERKPAKNIWHYHQTRGLGFYEYFQFCEDIGAEPLPVLAAGVPCQNSGANKDDYAGQQGGIPMAEMPAYCQEILNMIEWANGDPATSKWAKMRADAGHPAPFNLKYIGIGNEDIISTVFEERFLMIAKAIKQKYPDIVLCGTVGPFHAPSADYIEGWKFAKANKNVIDMVDEHYYESPGWFLHNQDYYDKYDRNAPKVYLGEWASKGRTMENALVEALHLCALERNADVVTMASYAPLLCNVKHPNWNPDMIYFNHDSITSLTPSYHTQKMWGKHSGNTYVASELKTDNENIAYRMGASVVKDATGKNIVKLVNALPSSATININGMRIAEGTVAEGFGGKPNDGHVQTVKVVVKEQKVTLPAYSVVAIKVE